MLSRDVREICWWLNLLANNSYTFIFEIETQFDKIVSDMKVRTKQRCVNEFLHTGMYIHLSSEKSRRVREKNKVIVAKK